MGGVEQRLERQAQSLGQRERQLEAAQETVRVPQRTCPRAVQPLKQQEVRSLGDVQRERVGSSYDYAQNVLDSAIKNVLVQDRLDNSNVLSTLAGST
jgi:hypothetical protein